MGSSRGFYAGLLLSFNTDNSKPYLCMNIPSVSHIFLFWWNNYFFLFYQFGGFSKYPGELPDIYHSYYGYTAFSLLEEPGLNPLCAELGMTDLVALGII